MPKIYIFHLKQHNFTNGKTGHVVLQCHLLLRMEFNLLYPKYDFIFDILVF